MDIAKVTVEALEAAYRDQVSLLFKVLVSDLREAHSTGSTMKPEAALAQFKRGMVVARDALTIASGEFTE